MFRYPGKQKAAPFLGPHFKRSGLEGLSGKAMQGAVPPGEAAFQAVVTQVNEGHCFGFAASCYRMKKHLPSQREGNEAAICEPC
jgi:hypothetical protein